MEKEPKYTNVRILFDNKNGEYSEAWAVIDGVKKKINDPAEVKKLAEAIMEQDNVNRIDLSPSVKVKFMYDKKENGKYKKRNLKNYRYNLNEEYEVPAKLRLTRSNPHTGKKTSGVTRVVITAAVVAAAIAAAKKMNLDDAVVNFFENLKVDKENEKDIEIEVVSETAIMDDKTIPETWEEYLTYENSVQKEFAVEVMDTLITPNIITKEIDGETITYGLTPEQATAFYIYYNSTEISNEDLLAILGDYSLTGNSDESKDLVNLVNSAVDTICLSWTVADTKEEMIRPVVKDQEVQTLIDKYMDLIMNYKKAEKKSDKTKAKKAIEEALSEDFINVGDGEVVNLYEQPAAHVILNSVPATMNFLLDPLDEDINKMIVGTEANYEVATDGGKVNNVTVKSNKITIPETNGLVDDACARLIDRFDNYDKFYQEKIGEKTTIDRSNEFAQGQIEVLEQQIATIKETKNIFNGRAVDAQVATYEAQIQSYRASLGQAEYDKITENSFEFNTHDEHEGVIVPIMDEYVKVKGLKGLGEGIQKFAEQFHEMIIAEIQAKQLNNTEPFSKSNPSGGKVGDSFVEGTERRKVTEAEISEDVKKAAQEEANKKADAISEAEAKNTEAEINAIIKAILAEKDALLNHYIKGGPNASEYNAGWANSEHEAVRNQYNFIKNEGIATYKEIQAIKDNNSTSNDGADKTPPTQQNPNQPGDSKNETTEPEIEKPSNGDSTITDEGKDDTPDHSQNPNQPQNNTTPAPVETPSSTGSSTEEIYTDYIPDTETTNPDGLFDASKYGDDMTSYGVDMTSYGVDMTSLDEEIETYDVEAAANAIVEAMANPEPEAVVTVEEDKQLTIN